MKEKSMTDKIVERSVGKQIKNDMMMISRPFYTLVEKYSFLFDGDIIKTQQMLIEACFTYERPLVDKGEGDEEDNIFFDMEAVIQHIPSKTKEEIYQKVLNLIASNIDVEELHSEKKEG